MCIEIYKYFEIFLLLYHIFLNMSIWLFLGLCIYDILMICYYDVHLFTLVAPDESWSSHSHVFPSQWTYSYVLLWPIQHQQTWQRGLVRACMLSSSQDMVSWRPQSHVELQLSYWDNQVEGKNAQPTKETTLDVPAQVAESCMSHEE